MAGSTTIYTDYYYFIFFTSPECTKLLDTIKTCTNNTLAYNEYKIIMHLNYKVFLYGMVAPRYVAP